MEANPFIQPKESYQRDINVLGQALEQTTIFLSRRFNISREAARAYINKQLSPGGRFEYKDTKITYLERNQYGDRALKEGTLREYIDQSVHDNEPIAPTFTTYTPVKVEKAVLAEYIEVNAAIRSGMKKEMIKLDVMAAMIDDPEEKAILTTQASLKNIGQKYAKQKNNSLSGTAASASTAFVNPSAHSTLTSVTRSTSGYANASNERFIAGNRHYHSPRIVLNALVANVGRCKHDLMQAAITEFDLYLPSVDDAMECIEYSCQFYWRPQVAPAAWAQLREFVATMTEVERASFVYTGDLYHLKKHNPELVRVFFDRLTEKCTIAVDDPTTIFWKVSASTRVLAAQICTQETMGLLLEKIPESPEVVSVVASTCANIVHVLHEYRSLINGIMIAPLLPGSIAYFPHAVRRAVIMSDTDSTIFTTEHWIEWKTGEFRITPASRLVTAAMVFLVENVTSHVLSTMAINMGVDRDMLGVIDMKNEFTFEVFAATMNKKHYFCLQTVKEGQQLKTPKKEIKGVGLIASTIAKSVKSDVEDIMVDILMTLRDGKRLVMGDLIQRATDIELKLKNEIEMGSSEFFKYVKVKTAQTYKQGEGNATYKQHVMWNDTFGKRYGAAPPLPYTSVKVSLDMGNKTRVREWIDQIEDVELKSDLRKWADRNVKTGFTNLHIPLAAIQSKGIPKEVLEVTNIDKIIYDVTSSMYMAYTAVGINQPQGKMFHHVYH